MSLMSATLIVTNVFEVRENVVNRVSGWGVVESAVVPDKAVLEFSWNRTCAETFS